MSRQVIDAARRQHLIFFLMKVFAELHPDKPPLAMSWYLQALCHALQSAATAVAGRLAVAIPPRHTKSIAASIALCAWCLGRDPTLKIMVATYSDKLAREQAILFRQVMQSKWYQALFPNTRLADGGKRPLELRTTAGGGRRAVTVGGSVTGFGADLVIVDDCLKADEARSEARRTEANEWFDTTLITRLNDPGRASIISIAQRLHEDDLFSRLVERGYDQLCLPSIAEKQEGIPIGMGRVHRRTVGSILDHPLFSREVLDKRRRDVGNQVFSAQHQQNPVAPEGNLIRLEWFGTFDDLEDAQDDFTDFRSRFHRVVQSWDTASSEEPTADFSVCTTWGWRDNHWDLIDVMRARLSFPDLRKAVLRLKHRWTSDQTVIEDANAGKSLWQEFRSGRELRPVMKRPDASKEDRVIGITAQLESGKFRLPVEAPWLDDFRSELRAFPFGRKDDQVDSMSQFIDYLLLREDFVLRRRGPTGRLGRPSYLPSLPRY